MKSSQVFEIKNEGLDQYQSAPQPSNRKPSKKPSLSSEVSDLQDESAVKHDKLYFEVNLSKEDENNNEEDFCDAADEDAEAGALGIIANNINKFDNHNVVELESKHINEKEALRNIIREIAEVRSNNR